MSGGSAGSAYAAEISALQTYQKQILAILDDMVASEAAIAVVSGVGSLATGTGGANGGLGSFPEAADLSQTYSSVMQYLMTNFNEISDLVTTMANVLGKSAQSYLETEQQLTDQFNSIVSKYESGGQTGGFTVPGTATSTAPTGTSPQTGTSSLYYSATPGTTTTTTTATSTASGTTETPTPSGSIEQDNNANASNDTSSEE